MRKLYYRTFAKVALPVYLGGTLIHISRLIFDFPITKMPVQVDWFVVLFAGYAGMGFLVFVKEIFFKSKWDRLAYALLVFHLLGSVLFHMYILIANDRTIIGIFPYWYSYIAVAYFAALGYYVLGLNKRFYHAAKL